MKQVCMRFACALVVLGLPMSAAAQDWTQWRGVNRDGAVQSFEVPATWPTALAEQWTVDVGEGYASPILIGERLYMFSRQGEEEVMQALDAATGQTRWRSSYPASFEMIAATRRHGPGPKATPVYADGRLFTLGISGIVTAFDAENGDQLWQRPADAVEPLYHTGQSPIVDGGQVILHVGGHDSGALTSFDVETGEEVWRWDGDGPAYGSPIVVEVEGSRQVITFTQENFVGVSVDSGTLLWSRPYTTQSTTTSQTPRLYQGDVIESGRGNGITRFRVVREGNAWITEDVWHNDEVSMHMSNAVVVDGVLFGLSHLNSGQYFALDLDSGTLLWTSEPRQADHASILNVGTTILSLEEDGELLVVPHSRTEFAPVQRYELADSATWTLPTISGNRLFVKDIESLTLWTVE